MEVDELKGAQGRLKKTLQQGRGEGRGEIAKTLRDRGQRLVTLWTGLLRLTRVHMLDNEAFVRPLRGFTVVLSELVAIVGAVHVITVEDQIYVNDVRVRLDHGMAEGLPLAELLDRHGLGGVSFHGDMSVPELRDLLVCYSARPDDSDPRGTIQQAIRVAGIHTVDVAGPFRFRRLGEQTLSEAEQAAADDRRRSGVVDDAWQNLGAGRIPNALPVRRLVTEMLKAGITADGLWRELGDASPECAHCIRVALCSLIIGDALGLNERTVQDLGVAAVFHDIGYAAREGSVRGAGIRRHVDGEAPPFVRHGAAGAILLMRQKGFRDEKVRRMLAVLEHHRDFAEGPSLFARIIRIAEDYDNLVRRGGLWLPPAVALEQMRAHSGTRYDPVLLQLFVNRVGRYPPGSILELEDGRQVRSVSLARSAETWDKPLGYLYRRANGQWPREREPIDLAEEGEIVGVVED